jgi:hypothetical protein
MKWNVGTKRGLKIAFGCFVMMALGLVLLVVSSLVFEPWMFQAPYRLAAGWFGFVAQKRELISIDPWRCITGFILAGVAVVGMHGLLRAWRRRGGPESGPWRWRWSLAIACVLLALGVAAVAATGGASQVAWLRKEPKIVDVSRSDQIRNANSAHQVLMIANHYAEEHQGKYPESLAALAKWAVEEEVITTLGILFFFEATPGATPEPWLYFGRGLDQRVLENTVLLVSPRAVRGKRIVGERSGRVEFLEEGWLGRRMKRK